MNDFAKKAQQLQRRILAPDSGRDIPRYLAAVLGGVFLGGVALALLNRKTILDLREKLDRRPSAEFDDIY